MIMIRKLVGRPAGCNAMQTYSFFEYVFIALQQKCLVLKMRKVLYVFT